MPHSFPSELHSAVEALAIRLSRRDARQYGSLTGRLFVVLDRDEEDARQTVRSAIWLADWNLFNGEALHAAAMAEEYGRVGGDVGARLEVDFRVVAAEAARDRDVIRALLTFGGHPPLAEWRP